MGDMHTYKSVNVCVHVHACVCMSQLVHLSEQISNYIFIL